MSDTKETTNVQEVELNIADILNTGAENVMTPADSDKKPSIFSPVNVDTSFLDRDFKQSPEPVDPPAAATPPVDTPLVDTPPVDTPPVDTPPVDVDPLAQPGAVTPDDDPDKNQGGRPTKSVAVLKALQDKGLIKPFDGEEDFSKYSEKDMVELFEMNLVQEKQKIQSELPEQFFGNMPVEMQQAYQYIANGGRDIRGMFQSLAASQEMQNLDVSTEPGQVHAVRSYLSATNYGTPEEIEDEIFSLKDRGDLEKKANQFKPKLDSMQQQIVAQRVAAQEQANNQRQQQAQVYQENVFGILQKGELNGMKLDNKVQNMLYAGLVQPNYPSVSGKQTNLFGHLIEKYQFVEPNHELIAEALWLLADPDGYRSELKGAGATTAAQETARTLKSAQADKLSSSGQQHTQEDTGRPVTRKSSIPRQKNNFFGR